MSHPNVTELSETTFSDFVAQNPNVVVDFWAPWCGPCKMFAPVFESTSGKFPDVKFVKVNVDDAQSIASKLGVRSIPTMLGFKDGQPLVSRVGSQSASQFEDFVTKFLATPSKAAAV